MSIVIGLVIYLPGVVLSFGAWKNARFSWCVLPDYDKIDLAFNYTLAAFSWLGFIMAFLFGARGLTFRTPKNRRR